MKTIPIFLIKIVFKPGSIARILLLLGSLFVTGGSGNAQGTLLFDNAQNGVSARVTFPDGRGVGEGFTAQLYGGPSSADVPALAPLFPITTFVTTSENARGYVNRVIVPVPGVLPGNRAKIVMRAFDGLTWETSAWRGESSQFLPTVGGGSIADGLLFGLQPFEVQLVPEPAASSLFLIGALLLLLNKSRHRDLYVP